MPIVSHTIEQTVQPNGIRSVVLRMQAQTGEVKQRSGFLNPDIDISAWIQEQYAIADVQLADEESQQVVAGG